MRDHGRSVIDLKAGPRPIRKTASGLSVILLAALGIGLILISPLALNWIGSIKGFDWSRLSNIGQTYGAISAVIAGIALAAIAISLILQSRSLSLTRMEIMRNYHHDLVKFTIEHPTLLPSWGYAPAPDSDLDDALRVGFVSVIIGFWRTSYEAKMIRDEELRQNVVQMFDGEVGRRFWAGSRHSYSKSIAGRRSRRFAKIIDEEYMKAEDSGPPVAESKLWSDL